MTQQKRAKQGKSTSGSEKGWPVRLAMCESAIRKQDEYVFREPANFVDEVVIAAEARVKEEEKTKALDFLCGQGCPRRELLYLLGMCENRGVTNAVKMTGYDSGELRQKLRELRKCALTIWHLNGREFGEFLAFDERSMLYPPSQLALTLRDYAALVEHAVKYIGGKSDFYLHLAKALLVDFVWKRTKSYHHKYVVDLLSVMFGDEYSEVDHRVWWGKYQKRLMQYRPDPSDSPSLRAKKTLLGCNAAIQYRMGILHPGQRHLRKQGRTVTRPASSDWIQDGHPSSR